MNAERVGSLFWLAVGLITLYGSYYLGLGKMREPGSGFLPFIAGCFISFMAIIVLLQSFTPKKEARAKLATLWAGVNWHRSLIISFLVLGFILALESLGFILTSFLLLLILFRWVEKFPWKKALIVPLLTLGCTYLLFNIFLKVSLPRGILGF
jgi:putative tricarboxylic transport membrane protein